MKYRPRGEVGKEDIGRPLQPKELVVFIASPGDVSGERNLTDAVVSRLDLELGHHCRLRAVRYERELFIADQDWQSQIPRPRECDVIVVILGNRLGSLLAPWQLGAVSKQRVTGTEYEFEDALDGARKTGRPKMLLFFKTGPLSVTGNAETVAEAARQRLLVDRFRRRWCDAPGAGNRRAYLQFSTEEEFEVKIEEQLRKLVAKLVRKKGKRDKYLGVPYPGLRTYDEKDEPVFLGRTRARAELREALVRQIERSSAFVLVFGASGSGKSSLVRAGLMADLRIPGTVPSVAVCRHAIMRPSDAKDPTRALARALLAKGALPELRDWEPASRSQELALRLKSEPEGTLRRLAAVLRSVEREARLSERGRARILIVVDQIEELFTNPATTARQREEFADVLAGLAQSGLAWVVATMRSDFFDRLERLPVLAHLSRGYGRYLLVPPTPDELGQIVRGPAYLAGLDFQIDARRHRLDDVIVRAAAQHTVLPLLQYLLHQLWQRKTKRDLLTFRAYRELGGLEGAIGNRADEVFSALPAEVRAAAPRVLRQLVAISPDGTPTGLAVPLSRFPEGSPQRRLVDAFRAEGVWLLAVDQVGDETKIRFAHEAILTHWPAARAQIWQDAEDLRELRRVESESRIWKYEDARHKESRLINAGLPLERAKGLLARWPDELSPRAKRFIQASVEFRRKQAEEQWRQRHQEILASAYAARIRFQEDDVEATLARLLELADGEGAPDAAEVPAEVVEVMQMALGANRLQASIAGHAGRVTATCFDGRRGRVISGAEDCKILIYDPAGRRFVAELAGHEAAVRSLAVIDERRLVSADDAGHIRVWDLDSGAALAAWKAHAAQVWSLAVSPDGRILSSAGDRYVRLWNTSDWSMLASLAHPANVNCTAFWHAGSELRLASGGDDRVLRIWDPVAAREIRALERHEREIIAVAARAEGTVLASGSFDGAIHVWTGDGDYLRPLTGHENRIECLAFHPTRPILVSGSRDNSMRLWRHDLGTPLARLRGHTNWVQSVAVDAGGTRVASASGDRTVRLWRILPEAVQLEIDAHKEFCRTVEFHKDDELLLSAGDDRIAAVWDAQTGKRLAVLAGHTDMVRCASFSPDGTRVVTASWDGTARVWDWRTSACVAELRGHEAAVRAASFDPSGSTIATASFDRTVGLWDAVSGRELQRLKGHVEKVYCVAFLPDGRRVLSGGNDRVIKIWDLDDPGQPRTLAGHNAVVNWLAVSADGRRIASASDDKTVRIWDADSGEELRLLSAHDEFIVGVAFDPSGELLATSGFDRTAKVWEVASGRLRAVLGGHYGPVYSVVFDRRGSRLATASFDRTVRVWRPPLDWPSSLAAAREIVSRAKPMA